eukprot:scaffold7375_cov268-Pinguiococcus_pyrenoidosus.AAC.16
MFDMGINDRGILLEIVQSQLTMRYLNTSDAYFAAQGHRTESEILHFLLPRHRQKRLSPNWRRLPGLETNRRQKTTFQSCFSM